jgi:DNA-binding transcriptional LysR family regulator
LANPASPRRHHPPSGALLRCRNAECHGARLDVAVAVAGNLRSNNGDALRTAAIAGQGLLYQPTFMVADDLRAGTLVALTRDQPTVEFGGIFAVYMPDRRPPAKVRAFIDFIASRCAPEPPWDRVAS